MAERGDNAALSYEKQRELTYGLIGRTHFSVPFQIVLFQWMEIPSLWIRQFKPIGLVQVMDEMDVMDRMDETSQESLFGVHVVPHDGGCW